MGLAKLRKGEWLAAASAVALLVVMLLAWFGRGPRTLSAWQAFSVLDLVLALLAALGLGLAALTATRSAPAAPVAALVVTTATAIVVTVALAVRLLFPPGPNALVGLEYGAFLGLLATVGIGAGAWIAMADERTEAADPPFVPAQPTPPATAPPGSLVAQGGVPGGGDDRD